MADSAREQKLAAARKKLRQFQKKKSVRRAFNRDTTDAEGSVTEESAPYSEGTLSSRASSVELVCEDLPETSHTDSPKEPPTDTTEPELTDALHPTPPPQHVATFDPPPTNTFTVDSTPVNSLATNVPSIDPTPTVDITPYSVHTEVPSATGNAVAATEIPASNAPPYDTLVGGSGVDGEQTNTSPYVVCADVQVDTVTQLSEGCPVVQNENITQLSYDTPVVQTNVVAQVHTDVSAQMPHDNAAIQSYSGEQVSQYSDINMNNASPVQVPVDSTCQPNSIASYFTDVDTFALNTAPDQSSALPCAVPPTDGSVVNSVLDTTTLNSTPVCDNYSPSDTVLPVSQHSESETVTAMPEGISANPMSAFENFAPASVPLNVENELAQSDNGIHITDLQIKDISVEDTMVQGSCVSSSVPDPTRLEESQDNREPEEACHREPQDPSEREGSVSSETTASITTAIHIARGDTQSEPVLKSSSESLRQISLQLSGLMSESEEAVPDSSQRTIVELERRNTELAALLHQETQTSQQHTQHIAQLKSHVERLDAELSAARGVLSSSVGGGAREVESLREQLQVHIQTIGILVAEKSELQTSLAHANHALKLRNGESTELDGRLSASRQRVGELESCLKDVTAQRDSLKGSTTDITKELDAAKMANFKANKQCEELRASCSELSERLAAKSSEHEQLTAALTEARSQLAMANLNLHQLRDSTSEELQEQLSKTQSAQQDSQQQLHEARELLAKTQQEQSQVVQQYQQYTAQLAQQMEALQGQVHQMTTERDQAVARLDETLGQLRAAEEGQPVAQISEEEVRAERERLEAAVSAMQQEKQQLHQQLNSMTNDNSQLSRLAEQLSSKVEELELQLDRSRTEEVDTSQLLEAMQSDKVAAARALTQNKQLKEQLEELQGGFIIMSNKKLELTEKLEKELHVKKGLNQEIAGLHEDITNMRQAAVEKEREIVQLKENSEALGAQLMLARSQLRTEPHTEASEQLSESKEQLEERIAQLTNQVAALQEKDKISQEHIAKLSENSTVQNSVGEGAPVSDMPVLNGHAPEHSSEEEDDGVSLVKKVAGLNATVQQLESTCADLRAQLHQARNNNNLRDTGELDAAATPPGDEVVEKYKQLQVAHTALEERFGRSMKEVAELTDEKQRLEYVSQQLQIETETIGDYITIYQFQRGVMKQQARERELELTSLRHEREEMKKKLLTLQELMAALMAEKGGSVAHVAEMEKVINTPPTPPRETEPEIVMSNGEATPEKTEIAEEATEETANAEAPEEATTEINGSASEEVNGESTPSKPQAQTDKLTQEEVERVRQKHSTAEPDSSKKSPTVQRILDLLSEMESTSHHEHCGLQKFHPCPLCSGKLITV